jgi:hypothetical protein
MDINAFKLRYLNIFYMLSEVLHSSGDDRFLAMDNLSYFRTIIWIHDMDSHIALLFRSTVVNNFIDNSVFYRKLSLVGVINSYIVRAWLFLLNVYSWFGVHRHFWLVTHFRILLRIQSFHNWSGRGPTDIALNFGRLVLSKLLKQVYHLNVVISALLFWSIFQRLINLLHALKRGYHLLSKTGRVACLLLLQVIIRHFLISLHELDIIWSLSGRSGYPRGSSYAC